MPHKTKKQKLAADRRRDIYDLPSITNQELTHKKKAAEKSKYTKYLLTAQESNVKDYTLTDLKKTSLVTFFLLTLEFLVFFASL